MMIELSNIPWTEVAYTILTVIIALIASKLVYAAIKKTMEKLASETKTRLDDILVRELELPVHLTIVLIAIWLSLTIYPGMQKYLVSFDLIIQASLILVIAYGIAKAVTGFAKWSTKVKRIRGYQYNYIIVAKKLINAVVYIIAIVIILAQFGIEITPIIASLGVGGLAVALAFQDTLENYFAGIYVSTDKSLEVGDYIEMEGGIAGTIEEIGWRTTRVRTWTNNLVIIPNKKLADAVITNYFKPDSGIVITLTASVSYKIKSDKAIKELRSIVEKIKKKTDMVINDFEPVIKIDSFGDSNINYVVLVKVKDRGSTFKFKELFNKALAEAYEKGKLAVDYNVVKLIK